MRPVYAALFALLAGILGAAFLPPLVPLSVLLGLCIACFCAALCLRQATAFVALLLGALALLGMARMTMETTPRANDASHWAGSPSLWVRGTVVSEPQTKPRGATSFVLRVEQIRDYPIPQPASGLLSVTVYPNATGQPPVSGEAVWVRGKIELPPGATNPNGFDYCAFLARRGIHATLAAKRTGDVRSAGLTGGVSPIQQTAFWVRRRVQAISAAHLPPDEAALLGGLLLSVRGDIPPDTTEAFVRTGTVHILSVSGLHIAALALCLRGLFGVAGLKPRGASVATLFLLVLFAVAAGGGAAVCRSVGCAALVLAAPLVGRVASDSLHTLCVAAFALLLLDPLMVFDAGAQLSFATVATILLFLPPLRRVFFPGEPGQNQMQKAANGLLLLLVVGVFAEIGSAPLTAYHFNRVSLIAPVANVLIAPLTEGIVLAGMGTVAVSPILPDVLTIPLWGMVSWLLRMLVFLAQAFGALPHICPSVESPPVGGLWAYYALLGGLAVVVRRRMAKTPLFAPAD